MGAFNKYVAVIAGIHILITINEIVISINENVTINSKYTRPLIISN